MPTAPLFPGRLIPLALLLLCAAAAPAASVADLTILYVNNEIITGGDVQQSMDDLRRLKARSGEVLPRTAAEELAFANRCLENLTDDLLLAQDAKSKGIVPDHQRIALEVLDIAKRNGYGLSLREQAQQRRIRERYEAIYSVLGLYTSMMPNPRPAELLQRFTSDHERQTQTDSTQIKIMQLVVRATDAAQLAQLGRAMSDLLLRAQDAQDPALLALVEKRKAEFFAATAAGQQDVLRNLTADLAASTTRTDLAAQDRTLVEQAANLARRAAGNLDAAGVRSLLERIRLSLTGRMGGNLIAGLIQSGREVGPSAIIIAPDEDPANSPWFERGSLKREIEDEAFRLQKNELSPVLMLPRPGDGLQDGLLILCTDRRVVQPMSFSEASGGIESMRVKEIRAETRTLALRMLRKRASVVDVNPVSAILE